MMTKPITLSTTESPREIIACDFPSLGVGLPIQGGWGYTRDDACIIVKDDPLVDQGIPFDGVSIEYAFVEKRIYEEMIIFRPPGEKFSGITWDLISSKLVPDDEKVFEHLTFSVSAFLDPDWEELKAEFEGPRGYGHPEFDVDAHERKRSERMKTLTAEYWFEISCFFGKKDS